MHNIQAIISYNCNMNMSNNIIVYRNTFALNYYLLHFKKTMITFKIFLHNILLKIRYRALVTYPGSGTCYILSVPGYHSNFLEIYFDIHLFT